MGDLIPCGNRTGFVHVPPDSISIGGGATPYCSVYKTCGGEVEIQWAVVPRAIFYQVFQGTAPGEENFDESVLVLPAPYEGTLGAVGLPPQTITGLTNGTTYYFKVGAYGSGGLISMSNEITATPQSLSFALTAVSAGSTQPGYVYNNGVVTELTFPYSPQAGDILYPVVLNGQSPVTPFSLDVSVPILAVENASFSDPPLNVSSSNDKYVAIIYGGLPLFHVVVVNGDAFDYGTVGVLTFTLSNECSQVVTQTVGVCDSEPTPLSAVLEFVSVGGNNPPLSPVYADTTLLTLPYAAQTNDVLNPLLTAADGGLPFRFTLTASGGVPPYTFTGSVASSPTKYAMTLLGSLSASVYSYQIADTLEGSSGTIGTATFTVTDSFGNSVSQSTKVVDAYSPPTGITWDPATNDGWTLSNSNYTVTYGS